MAPRKPRRRPQPADVSDYDSEQPATTDVRHHHHHYQGPPHPPPPTHTGPPPTRTNEELNLSVLRRHDPSIQQVLSVAGFACVYRFSAESQTWVKIGIEGALFVCELLPVVPPIDASRVAAAAGGAVLEERYGVVVLNRKGLNNFVVGLTSQGDVDVDEQYTILQVGEGQGSVEEGIYGLWIFCPGGDTTEREGVAAVIMECAGRAERSRLAAVGDGVGQKAYDEGYEQGYENGFGDGGDAQRYEELDGTHRQQSQQPAGQQIDLLSLFGQAAQAHQAGQQQWQQQGQSQYRQEHQQHGQQQQQQPQGQPPQNYYPHAHPPPPPPTQPTQAQNLLSLFKR